MRSKVAKPLLGKRWWKTGVRTPFFSEKRARLHLVPPTSPAMITKSAPDWYEFDRHHSIADSRVVPLAAAAFEQKIGLAGAPASCGILGDAGGLGGAPNVEDGVDESPGGFDAVPAIEKCGVAAATVTEKCGVGAARTVAEGFS